MLVRCILRDLSHRGESLEGHVAGLEEAFRNLNMAK